MKKSYLILFVILFSISTYAQQGIITGIYTLPANPTTNDTVKLIVNTQFTSGGCNMQFYNLSGSGTLLSLQVFHCVGIAAYICDAIDTIPLGVMVAGSYLFNVDLLAGSSFGPTGCTNYAPMQSQSFPFAVSNATGLQPNENNNKFLLQPNPVITTQSFSISNFPSDSKVIITDMRGKLICELMADTKNNFTLPSLVQPGIYLCAIVKSGRIIWNQKLVVQ